MNEVIKRLMVSFRQAIQLTDYIDTAAAERSIRGNIYFRGPNAWILAIAIVIASVGLNVNSIPVIIGAMLISPLMGPIFGMGLGLGINDLPLIKSSGKNLLVMVGISLAASFVYFLITPLSLTNPSELLARTNPTIYDVLIALFGGFAGILEQCRKDKGTVFAGVAIATALMPPLCTAGFGLASGSFSYFIGATYLFVINCIFIMLATYISVKYFGFREVTFADKCKVYGRTILYDYKIDHTEGSVISLFFSGEPLSDQARRDLIAQAAEYNISEQQVIINEYTTIDGGNDIELVKSIYDKMDVEVSRRDAEIHSLRQQLDASQQVSLPYVQLTREIIGIYPSVRSVVIARGAVVGSDSLTATPCVSVIVRPDSLLSPAQSTQLTEWLRVRLSGEPVILSQQVAEQ